MLHNTPDPKESKTCKHGKKDHDYCDLCFREWLSMNDPKDDQAKKYGEEIKFDFYVISGGQR